MSKKHVNLLFDVTLLLNESSASGRRAGQFFVAYHLLLELLKCDKIHVTLYSEYRQYIFLNEFIRKYLKDYSRYSIYSYNSTLDKLTMTVSRMLLKYQKRHGRDNILKKGVRFIGYRIFHIYERYFSKLNVQNYDAFFTPSDPISPEMLKIKKLKKYAFLHDTVPVSLKDFYLHKNPFIVWYNNLEESLSVECTYFTNSETTKEDFLTYYPFLKEKQFHVALLGAADRFRKVDNQDLIKSVKLKYDIPTDKKYAFILSSFDPRKNFFFALDNFIEFIKTFEIDDFVLVIAGAVRESFREVMDTKLASLPEDVKEKVLKIGYVDDEDVPVLLSGALMFVMPSIYEGFGMPILEAMQCECPVICSKTSAMPEVIGDCGITINPYDDAEMVSAYSKMYFNEKFRKKCIAKGLSRAKNFSWERCAGVIIDTILNDFNIDKN